MQWLLEESMLGDASAAAGQFSSVGGMMQNPFGIPNPTRAIEIASVWFTAYPASMITKRDESFLATLSDDSLWASFEALGISAVHTGPVKRAGGLSGWDATPSVDGQFDRISTQIDAAVRDRARVSAAVRGRRIPRRHRDRRHRSRPHRQGR